MINGTKKTYRDYKFTKNIVNNKFKDEYTALELSELKRIKYDAFRLAPFTFFLVVPLSEFLLPPYLYFL